MVGIMPLNQILRKCTTGKKTSKSQENIDQLMYMNDIKLFAKNKNDLEDLIQTVGIYREDIKMEIGIEKCGILVTKSGK